jgi:hypothetical protein
MMTLLEERYRWWLRLLPAWYRLDREEEMVATFMEVAGSGEDAEVSRPTWVQIRGVLTLAVRTRLGGAGAVPRARAWGDGARVFALAAVLMQACFATVMVWDVLQRPIFLTPGGQRQGPLVIGTLPVSELELRLAPTVWIVAYLALVLGRWRAARWFALAAAVHTLYALSATPVPFADAPYAIAVAVGLGVLPAVAVVAAFHQDAPPVPRAGPLIALPVGAALIGLWTHLIGPGAPAWLGLPDLPAIYCWPFLAASGGYAVTRKVTGRLQGPGWPLGLVLLAVPVFAARVLGLVVYLGQQTGSQPG